MLKEYSFSIPITAYVYENVPLWVLSISAQKVLNKCKKYAPIESGHLQDSIKVYPDDFDKSKVTIFVDETMFKDWGSEVPYFKYLNEDGDKHYRRGAFKGQTTKGWWKRLCAEFFDLWRAKADKLEGYKPKPNDANATAKEHRRKVEEGNIRKLNADTKVLEKGNTEREVAEVPESLRQQWKEDHQTLRGLTRERKGWEYPRPNITMMSVKDMQSLSIENMQYLLNKELGINLPIGIAGGKRQLWKMKDQLDEVREIYGEVRIGGIPVRTIIRELKRKLQNSEQMGAY